MSANHHTSFAQISPVELPNLDPKQAHDETIYSIAHGHLPKKENLNETMDKSKEYFDELKKEGNLDEKGEQLADDVKHIIENAQTFLNEKNITEKLQDISRHGKEASKEVSREASKLSVAATTFHLPTFLDSLTKYGMAKDALSALDHGKNIALYILKSNEFKNFLMDLTEFMHSMASDSVDKMVELKDSVKEDYQNSDITLSSTTSEIKDIAVDVKDNISEKASEWNAERREKSYHKFTNLMRRAAENPETKLMMDVFFNWLDLLRERVLATKEILSNKLGDKVDEVKAKAELSMEKLSHDSYFEATLNDISDLIDQFAGKGAFRLFYTRSFNLWRDVVTDDRAHQYFKDMQSFMKQIYDNPNQLEEKAFEANQLIERGRIVMYDMKFRDRFNQMFRQFWRLLDKIVHDKTTVELAESIKKFGEDFALDKDGKPDLYVIQNSLVQLKNLIYPILKEKLGCLRIGEVIGSTDTIDYRIEDLHVCVPDILPQSFELKCKTDMKVDVNNKSNNKAILKVKLDMADLKPSFKNVKYWYKKNTFPKIEDNGVADVDLSGGNGVKIVVLWKIRSSTPSRPFAFSLTNVNCTIDKLSIKIKEAKHDILDSIATSLFEGKIKQGIAQGIVGGLVGVLEPMNAEMNSWFAAQPFKKVTDQVNRRIKFEFDHANDRMKDSHPIERIRELAYDVKEDYKVAVENAREVADDKYAQMRESVQDKVDLAKEIKKDLPEIKERLIEAKDTTIELAKEGAVLGKEAASAVKEKIEKGIEVGLPVLEEGMENLKEFSKEKLEQGKQLYEEGKEIAKDSLEYGKEIASEKLEEGKELLEKGKEIASEKLEQGKEIAKEKLEQGKELYEEGKEVAKEKLEKGKEVAKEKLEQGKELAKEGKEIASEKLEKGKEIAKEKLEQGKELAKEGKEVAKEKLEEGKKVASEKLEEGKKVASEKLEEGKKIAKEGKEVAKEKLEEGKKVASEKLEEGKKVASEKLEEGKKVAKEGKEKVEEKVEEGKEKGKTQAKQTYKYVFREGKDLGEKAQKLTEDLKQKATEVKERAKDKAEDVKEDVKEKVEEVSEESSSYVEEVEEDNEDDWIEIGEKGKWIYSWEKPKKQTPTANDEMAKKYNVEIDNQFAALNELNPK